MINQINPMSPISLFCFQQSVIDHKILIGAKFGKTANLFHLKQKHLVEYEWSPLPAFVSSSKPQIFFSILSSFILYLSVHLSGNLLFKAASCSTSSPCL